MVEMKSKGANFRIDESLLSGLSATEKRRVRRRLTLEHYAKQRAEVNDDGNNEN